MCAGRTYPILCLGVTLDLPGPAAVVISRSPVPGRTRSGRIPPGSPRRRGHGGGARPCVAALPAGICVEMPRGRRVIFWRRRGVYHMKELVTAVTTVWPARRGRQPRRRCAGVTTQLTLSFFQTYPRLFDVFGHGARCGRPAVTGHILSDREFQGLPGGI